MNCPPTSLCPCLRASIVTSVSVPLCLCGSLPLFSLSLFFKPFFCFLILCSPLRLLPFMSPLCFCSLLAWSYRLLCVCLSLCLSVSRSFYLSLSLLSPPPSSSFLLFLVFSLSLSVPQFSLCPFPLSCLFLNSAAWPRSQTRRAKSVGQLTLHTEVSRPSSSSTFLPFLDR